MTDDRTLKQAIRRRMEQTAEKYIDARRAVLTLRSLRAKQPAPRRIWEPPTDVLPVPVSCDCVLARTPRMVVAAGFFAAYATDLL